MCHSLASLQHRHFNTRRIGGPETCLFTFRGADAFSFGDGIRLQHEAYFPALGKPLRTVVRVTQKEQQPVRIPIPVLNRKRS